VSQIPRPSDAGAHAPTEPHSKKNGADPEDSESEGPGSRRRSQYRKKRTIHEDSDSEKDTQKPFGGGSAAQSPKDKVDRKEPKLDTSLANALRKRQQQREDDDDPYRSDSDHSIHSVVESEPDDLETSAQIRAAMNERYVLRYYILLYLRMYANIL
jgi:hypothetical protein